MADQVVNVVTATGLTGTLAVANGGTGSGTAGGARTNLGLGTIATQDASNVSITGGSISGITDLAIADGGTGASTATAAFDALSPLTTQGDLLYRNAANNVRLAAGTNGQVLTTGGGSANPAWGSYAALSGQLAFGDANGLNPSASTTYYFGTLFGVDPGTTDDPPSFTVPIGCTLVAVYGAFYIVGTLASAQNTTVVVRKNAASDILTVSSTVSLAANPARYSSTGNSVAIAAGDRLYIKWTTGAWTTNPTLVFGGVTLYFERP